MREEQKPAAVAVPPGWRLVPAEPTAEWEAALGEKGMRISTMSKSIADVLAAAPQPPVAAQEPFGYVNTHTGQFFKDVEPCRQNNEGHWRTVYTLPAPQPAPVAQGDALDVEIAALESSCAHLGRLIDELRPDAERYQYLRERDLDTIRQGGVFAGRTPDNVVLNGDDLDAAIDAARAQTKEGGA